MESSTQAEPARGGCCCCESRPGPTRAATSGPSTRAETPDRRPGTVPTDAPAKDPEWDGRFYHPPPEEEPTAGGGPKDPCKDKVPDPCRKEAERLADPQYSRDKARLAKELEDYRNALNRGIDDEPDKVRRNAKITLRYADLFAQNDDLIWAGMAARASELVGEGIGRLELAMHAKELPKGMQGPVEQAYEALWQGNLAVYKDLYWIHRMFQEDPNRLRTMLDHCVLWDKPRLSHAFRLLDRGARLSLNTWNPDDLKKAEELFREAGRQIICHEQTRVIQTNTFNNLGGEILEALRKVGAGGLQFETFGQSPFPGSSGFEDYFDRKGKRDRPPSIADLDDRMDWTLNDLLPAFLGLRGNPTKRRKFNDAIRERILSDYPEYR